MNKFRVFWAGANIAGHYQFLHDEFIRLGFESHLLVGSNKFQYKKAYKDKSLATKIYQYINKERAQGIKIKRYSYRLFLNLYFLTVLLPWMILKIDVIFYCAGETLSDFKIFELGILKLFKKRIIVTFHGSDARPAFISGVHYKSKKPNKYSLAYIHKITKSTYKKVKIIEKFADEILVSPSVSTFFNRKLVDISLLGNPVDEKNFRKKTNKHKVNEKNKLIKILHSPSEPLTKGTYQIEKMVKKLIEMGFPIDFSLIKDQPNQVILESLQETDIVIDSLWNECPSGTFPAEAAFCGKPVLIGSYFAYPEYDIFTNSCHIPPYIFVTPENFFNELFKLVSNSDYRQKKGEELFSYMKKYKTLTSIANLYIKVAESNIEEEFIYHPNNLSYKYGYGANKDQIKEFVKKYISTYGKNNLFISKNKLLEQKLLDF